MSTSPPFDPIGAFLQVAEEAQNLAHSWAVDLPRLLKTETGWKTEPRPVTDFLPRLHAARRAAMTADLRGRATLDDLTGRTERLLFACMKLLRWERDWEQTDGARDLLARTDKDSYDRIGFAQKVYFDECRLEFSGPFRAVRDLWLAIQPPVNSALPGPELALPDNDDMPSLSETQYLILEAMLDLKAISADTRQTATEIAQMALGESACDQKVKVPLSDLKKRHLVDSRTGNGGGSWLTNSGVARARTLQTRQR